MTQLFDRDIEVNIGGLLLASHDTSGADQAVLRIVFDIVKTGTSKPPNKARLEIYNLSEDSRSKIQEQKRLPVSIKAGYRGNIAQLFIGDMRFGNSSKVGSSKEGADWVTTIEAGDGAKEFKSKRISQSLAPGTKVTDALKKAAEALGVGTGNLDKVIAAGSKRAGLSEYTNGTVLSGKASDSVDNIVKSMGLEWSIQDGQLQILEPKQTTQDTAVVLESGTGLVGSPAAGDKGIVKATSLLQPDIFPGRKIQLKSFAFEGTFFKATKVRHTGDTWGTKWFTEMELKPL